LETAAEKLHPLFLHLERVKAVIYVFGFDGLEEIHQLTLSESITYVFSVFYESEINLCCVSGCLGDV
jgi:hypothetical protein